jgi:hypothetical protein
MEVRFSKGFARTTLKILLLIALLLCSISFASQAYALVNDSDMEVLGVNLANDLYLLDVDAEASVPTWFSSSILLLCSMLLGLITYTAKRAGDRYSLYWGVLSIVFVLMSLDEQVSIHERFIEPLRSLLDTGGILYFASVLPGIVFVVIFGLVYRRFLFNLPVTIRRLFVGAGALYVLGSIGMEMVGGFVADLRGEHNLPYITLTTVEEFLEMFGAIVFLYALIRYTHCFKEPTGRIGSQNPAKRTNQGDALS